MMILSLSVSLPAQGIVDNATPPPPGSDFRITEQGDRRITEQGDDRVTE